ncbi:MAG: biotin transporter BioY [Microbacteriaceae bacterium]|nr:biotin transporter BioY [Microbacteriaceae bacterium]
MARKVRFELRDLTRIAVFSAIIAVLGLPGAIPIFGSPVPIVVQNLGMMLAGVVLGPWAGAAAVLVFEVLVFAGLPLLSGGHGGAAVFFGPTAGYLIGWVVGAFVIGLIVNTGTRKPQWWRVALGCVVGGIVVVYGMGIPVLAWVLSAPIDKMALSNVVYLPGDVIKVIVATVISLALWRAYPQSFVRTAAVTARVEEPAAHVSY